ncbi:hypothetical protein [Pseudomonas spirodelae]|uniref:Lipoprotein n=1 Tax=Pseudomonas spirodelae TaxID=3101751 RepID=A0ABU5PA61_9PSED|nr:hypothetical protein [Pseudomonas sp. T5W1]MBU0900462.1 hypothetical protein [Gammaproteobacteria bacterium]MEA1606556.1 hypothetical protein [Pseudomonas sp. T5W1]
MSINRIFAAASVIVFCTGCASGLNSHQEAELKYFEARGQAVEEKNPGLGAALGLLPGGGSFYGREYGLGVVNLLFWPLSILWDPVSGHDASQSINYQATKAHLHSQHERELDGLDEQLQTGQIDITQYTLSKRKVDQKYRYN